MTRPTDASIARAFFYEFGCTYSEEQMAGIEAFTIAVLRLAKQFDAEAANSAWHSEDVMRFDELQRAAVVRWAEGKTSPQLPPRVSPERLQFLADTAEMVEKIEARQQDRMRELDALLEPAFDHCSKCTAHMPPGLHCAGPYCPLRK